MRIELKAQCRSFSALLGRLEFAGPCRAPFGGLADPRRPEQGHRETKGPQVEQADGEDTLQADIHRP